MRFRLNMYFYLSCFLRWRETEQLTTSGENPEKPGYSLVIDSLSIKDLGPYTCQAYNGVGQAPSSRTELRVMGPIDTSGVPRDEQKFLRYVVDAPTYVPERPYIPVRQTDKPYDPSADVDYGR